MLKTTRTSFQKAKRNIILFALINCACYVVFMLIVKYTNLLHVAGMRTINYAILAILSIVQVKSLAKQEIHFPFLEVFSVTIVTGTISFFLFSIFLFFYSFFDPYLNNLYIMDIEYTPRLAPPLLMFFEGSGISVIIGLITMEYAGWQREKGIEKFKD
ncbi:MAG: hypothetical protein JNL60_15420 [Bacteroidia bacterium]|nr:hypothetical protein [Bacteroidia bacterium]